MKGGRCTPSPFHSIYHRVHRVAITTFRRTCHHVGKIRTAWWGLGGTTPFHSIYRHEQSFGVRYSWEGRYTPPPISPLPPYMYSVLYATDKLKESLHKPATPAWKRPTLQLLRLSLSLSKLSMHVLCISSGQYPCKQVIYRMSSNYLPVSSHCKMLIKTDCIMHS